MPTKRSRSTSKRPVKKSAAADHNTNSKTTSADFSKKIDAATLEIQDEIVRVGNEFRDRHPWVEKYQDLIGLTILLTFSAVTVATAWLMFQQKINYWLGFFLVMFATSIVHEIEHDTIHYMYFKGGFVNDLMLLVCWLVRWNTINPWTRRRLHFWHHKASGTETDLEERGITNGVPWGLKRLLMILDNGAAFWMRPIEVIMVNRGYRRAQHLKTLSENVALTIENIVLYAPFGWVHFAATYSFAAYYVVSHFYGVQAVPKLLVDWMPLISAYVWNFGLPNHVRTSILVFVSSDMHYYGDVGIGEVLKQTQVWRTWWTLPLDLFTFNFGSTHGIHHFVVRDPFYLRQLTASSIYPIMMKNGVRFNDFGSLFRANRFDDHYSVPSWHL